MSEIDIDALPEIKDGESTDIGAFPEIDIDALPEIKDGEQEAEERPALPAEFPDVSPGIVNYKAIGENAAQAARERAAEEPKIVREKRTKLAPVGIAGFGYPSVSAMTNPQTEDVTVVNGITDTHGNTAKVGDVISVEEDDGVQVRTDGGGKRYSSFRFVGDDEKGTPLFKRLTEEEAEKETPKATMAKRVFRRMRGEGRIKMDSTPMEQVRLGILAETGREDLFGEGASGQMQAAAHRAVPYIGRYLRDKYVGQIRSLSELREGKVDGDWRRYLSDDIRTGKLDRAKFGERRADETEDQFRERLRASADEELKKRVGAMQEAAEEIGGTERDVTDLIVGGFIESSGYAGEFLIPGGVYGKALKGAKLLKRSGWVADKMNRLLRSEAIAAPVIAAEAVSRYAENTTPGFEILDDGTLQLRYEADTPAQAALSAIGGAVYDTNVEMGLEPLAMGVLRLAKKPAGWTLGKMTPRVIQDMGAKRFSEFMASGLGRDLQAAYRAYSDFTDMTQINSPLGELAEEYFQAMERPLRMEGKASEYRGFAEEWNRFCDEQHSLKTQFETFLGLVGQLAIGSATSVYGTVKNRNDNAEVWRDIRGRLKRSGISDENIDLLTDRQREVLTDIWRRYSANPEKMREMVKGLGYAMRTATEELAGRNNLKFEETLEKMGLEPAKFKVAYAENGDLEFRHIQRFETDDKAVTMDAMVDAEHGVTVCDNKDGTYTVMNDLRGTTAKICPNFTQAYALATQEARRNQLAEENNRKKAEYFAEYIAPNYSGRDFHLVDSVETLRREMLQAIQGGGSYFGITDASSVFGNDAEMHSKTAGGFHAPDGTTVIVLDNIVSPNDMERVAAHEATGHEGVRRQADDVVAFATEIESESFDKFQDAVYRSRALHYMAAGYGEEEAQQKAWEDVMSERGKQEVMANYAQDRLHEPTPRQRKRHAANEARRAKGENVPMDDADLEVALARAEAEGRIGTGKVTRGQGVGFRDIEAQAEEAEEAPKEETGNAPESAEEGTPSAGAMDEEKPVSAAPQATQGGTEKPVGERNIVEKLTDKAEAQELPLDEIEVSDSRIPQFKENADPVTGEVEPLTGEPYDLVSNPIVVMEFNDGKKVVVTGRHRYGLYKRSGRKTIAARVIREADGWTVKDAMAIDAIGNIIDEKGTEKDYVKYFDEAKPSREEAKSAGFLDRPKGQRAFSIYEGATPDTKQLIDWEGSGGDGKISVDQAGIISAAAPKDADRRFGAVQRILVQKALAGLRGKKLGILARSLAEEAKNRKDTPKVGGEMQLDLFTSEEDQALLAMEDKRAEYRVGKANEYGRIAEVLRTAVSKGGKLDLNAEYAQELGITDAKDKAQLVAARDKAVERANYWENAVTLDAADKAAMDAEITEKSEKAAAKREEIKAKAEAKIAEVKAKRTGKKAEKPVEKPAEASAGAGQDETETQLTEEEKRRSAANAAFTGMTGIRVVQVGADGKVLSDTNPIADKVTGVAPSKTDAEPSKTDEPKERGVSKPSPKTKMRSAEEEAKAEKAEDDLAALFDTKEYDENVEKYMKWTDKYHLNPYKNNHVKEFSQRNGVYFDTATFDPEVFQKRVGALAKVAKVYVDNGVGTFETLAERLKTRYDDKFGDMKPYLRGIWNAVAEQMELPEVTKERAAEIFDTLTNAKEADNGNARTTGEQDGAVLDAAPAADVAGTAEGEAPRGPSDRDRGGGPQPGIRDGVGRGAEGVPVVGPDVGGAAGGVPAGDGARGQGDTQEGGDAPQDAAAVAGGRGAGAEGLRVPLDAGTSGRVRSDGSSSGSVAEAAHKAAPEKPSNYAITAEDEHWLNTSSPGDKVANNLAVIKLLAELSETDRKPTAEERTMLARYVGFGGFPQVVDQKYKDAYKTYGDVPSGELPPQTQAALKKLRFGLKGFDTYRELRQYLTQEEFDAIRQAMINAFYTPIDVCRSMHNALKAAGFNGGRMLEPSAGTGNMVGTGIYDSAPHWTAVELDKTTGKILEYLYPESNVKIQGFQEVVIPHNFIDAAITNVPFSNDIHPYDPEYNKYDFNLHDYFFAKTVDALRPGGVAALISSTGTLDKTDKTLLRFMEDHGGKIVGAVRLPNGHQSKNSGTEVAADIIFIQKVAGRADNSAFTKNGEMFGIKINDYFVRHPEMIFGTPEAGTSMYGNAPAIKFKATREPSELDATILKAAEGLKYLAPNETQANEPLNVDADRTGLRRGNIGIVDGKAVKREGDVIVPLDIERMTKATVGANGVRHRPLWPESMTKKGATLENAIRDISRLRDAYRAYIDAQKHADEETVMLKRASLNGVYDAMIAKYKHFNEGAIAEVFDLDDADGIILQGLEAFDLVPDGVTKTGKPKFKKANFRKADALKKRTLFGGTKADKADNTLDGLRISLNESGTVNLGRIAELTGKTKESVSSELVESGHVFQNPSTGVLETRDEYLSGSVRRKLREARAAAEVDPSFRKNVEELEKVQPEDKPATKIKYQLGQNFIPNEMYVEFLSERVFGTPEAPGKATVGYDEKKDTWVVAGSGSNMFFNRKCPEGTDLEDILVRIFNGSSLTVKDRIDDGDGKYHYVPNAQKTQAVEALRDDITAELSKWMVATPERAKRIERAYNDKMNDNVERQFDTSLLTLDGISDEWATRVNTPGYEHQKRAITRGVFGGNLYIQHCVGAGKSFEMFSICMQLRRLGLARKPMLTVPNHMVESGQVLREFKEAYPGANILVATTKDLNSTNRRRFLAKAANGDWDCIVVPHSSFSLIGMDPKVQAAYIQQEIDDLREMVEAQAASGKKKGNAEKRIEKKIASKMEKMKKLLDASKKDSTVPFENIGVDYIFVDEAHNFKGLDITTKMKNVSGVTGSVSQRAQDLEMKCRYLAQLHGGDRGVIFASGTPISNSISESYTNARFMTPTRMREMGIYRFDDWAKNFGVVETKAAPRASGKGYQEKTRFARFQNLVELKRVNFAYADIVLDSDLNIPRPFMAGTGEDGKSVLGKPIVHKIPATDLQKQYVESLDQRLDSFKGGRIDPKVDNPLKVVTEGRLLAIDPGLLGLHDEHRRLETIADNVYRIWKKSVGIVGKDGKTVLDGTQLVFCDSGVPKPKKFSKVVRTKDGGFATKSGNYWQFYVSDVDANGMRHAKAVRSDGATFSPAPFADHARNGLEDISGVYAAFDEMAQTAAEYGKKKDEGLGLKKYQEAVYGKQEKPKRGMTHAKDPEGEPFDINAWLDENSEIVGYDVRFENPYSAERMADIIDYDEADETPEEEIADNDGEDDDTPEKDQDEANNGDVAVENMLRGKFNIYSYLKKALVRRGVPAEDIVFIHDAEDAKAKRALFEKFNADGTAFRGGPRILIGNTPKMGEGANVQRRLVAIHHADIPWKPAWLTQRDGRGIRAGNLNESIGIHRYVTENTFDVYSYDKVSGKQQFINQVQSHDMSQDEIEDVDDAVLAAEEAKAAAAGPIGKYMMAKTRLEQGIRKAELTLANQQSDIFNAQSGIQWDEKRLQDAIKKMEADKAMLDKFAEAKGDKPFGIEVIDEADPNFGKVLTDNDELQKFLMKKVNEFVRKGAEDGLLGRLYGMPVWWKETRALDAVSQFGRIEVGAINAASAPIPIINRVAPIAKSTVSQFKSAVTHATSEKMLDEDHAAIASAERRFEASKESLAKLKVDETLPGQIEDMKVELATTLNILGAKDAGIQSEAERILNQRILEGRDAEAAAVAYAELTKPQPVERQISDLENESAIAEFDSPEFGVESAETVDEKTFGFTNEEVALGMKAADLPVPKHVTKHDEQVMRQADVLLSNREYMRKLAHAVLTRKGHPTSDYENVALGIYAEQSKDALNAAKGAYDEMSKMLAELPADTDAETVDALKKSVRELRAQLAGARRDFREASAAKMKGASEQGRALRTNRFLIDAADYSYAGIRGQIEAELGKEEMPEKMDEEIGRLAENFKDLDERARKIAVERLKEFSKKVLDDMRRGGREAAGSGAKNAGNELKRVMRNYEDAMTQVQVHADEAGGTLIGLADQLYPSWGKWIRAIGEYHCYLNPDITEQGVIDAIREDLGRYLEDGIDETTVRDILTGFGHNYRQSRYDAQRKMNDLKAQALAKRQRDYMVETGKLPPQTGMVRDEPSDETRALRKEVQEIKKDIDEQEGGPRALKGALDSAKTRIRNQIADLENAIATGERIERSKRTLMEDAELKALKARRDELRNEYEAAFGERSTLTDEQRAKRAEKSLHKALERALERLGRAYGGDFSKAPMNKIDSPSIQALRDEISNTNKTIRDLKDAAFPMGTPEEIAKKNARRMEAREKAIQRLQERIISGDIRPTAKKSPPMPPDMQKQYDELGRQMKDAHRKLQQLREEARHATWFAIPREALEMHNYIVGSIMTNAASYDRSAVLRQALRLTAAKPVDAVKAYAKAEKAAWNEEYFNEVNGMVLADPIIREGMEKHGLRLHSNDIAHVHTLEMFRTPNTVAPRLVTRIGQMIGDIPIVGKVASKIYGAHTYIKEGSERHYVTYLNLMAGQTYKLLVDAMPGGASEFQKRKIAGLINILSGSGSMPERLRDGIAVANTINNTISPIIWSPSLWVSQIQHKAMADVWGAYIGKSDDVKEGRKAFYEATMVAKEAMKLRIRATLAIAALGAMISYACGNDEWWDELVANANKLNLDGMMRVWEMIHHPVIGKTHIDLEMGERAFSRTIGSLVSGKVETSTLRTKKFGTYGGGDWYGLFGRYIGGKISPAYGALISFLQGRDYVGNPYGTKDLATSWIPLSMSDVFQSAIEDDWLDGTAPVAVTMTMLGAGGSVYDDKWYERTVNPFLENAKDIRDRQKDPLLSEDERKSMIDDIKNAAGGIFADDAKWQKAEAIAKSVRSNEMKLKKATSDLELAIKTGKNVNTEEALRMINEKSNEVNGLKRDLMDMILQQDNGNSFRPWRRR